jgi:Polyketide cyclase / dehydrase and lipid transport
LRHGADGVDGLAPLPLDLREPCHFTCARQWQSMVRESEKVSQGPVGPGAQFREFAQAMGSKGWVTIDINEYEPNRRLGYRSSRFGALAPIAEFRFEPASRGTRITFNGDPESDHPAEAAITVHLAGRDSSVAAEPGLAEAVA